MPPSEPAVGVALINAIAALGNPRPLPNTRTIILDAQIYMGSATCETLLGSLRFYNAQDMVFNNTLHSICATFARMEDSVDQNSITDYHFIGDLQWAIPLYPDLEQFDPCQRTWLSVSGGVSNVDTAAHTFTLDVEHYISAFKDLKDANNKPMKPIAPFLCEFSARYRNRTKPVLFNRRYVFISGFLTNVIYKQKSKDLIERFVISIDQISFMGQQASSPAIQNTLDTPFSTPQSGKGLFNFRRPKNSPIALPASPIIISIPPATPNQEASTSSHAISTPTPSQRQTRKRHWDSDNSSSDIFLDAEQTDK